MSERSVEYECKILPLGIYASLAMATNLSIWTVFIGIFIGIPMFINVILLVGIMFLIFYYISTSATFEINDRTLSRILEKKSFLFRSAKPKVFTWETIKSYKNGTDRGKFRGEYQYLEVNFKNGDNWTITDMYGEKQAEFTPFLQFFLSNVNRFNQEKKEEIHLSHPHTATEKESIIPNPIERKKTIYESVFGKIFTVLLGFVIILFLVYGLPYMGIPSLLKLYIFLIPGFFYMAYRVFIKKG